VFHSLRDVAEKLGPTLFGIGGRAVQIVAWGQNHRYCGRCGAHNQHADDERAQVCPECGLMCFPRLSPAIIVRIERGDQILLARNHRFPPGLFSVLAGFVEPGETLEECVAREVREEVGIEVEDIHYFASQPWPFPNSLMLGFTARYKSGEIQIEASELAEAGWYDPHELPGLPMPVSIARRLIDDYLKKHDAL
jgi:NAD+ diphosphatase